MTAMCECGRPIDGSRTLAADHYEKCSTCRREAFRRRKAARMARSTIPASHSVLTDSQRRMVEQALRQIEATVPDAHSPLANQLLPAVDEIRKALDLEETS